MTVSANLLQALASRPEISVELLQWLGRGSALQRMSRLPKLILAILTNRYDVLLISGWARGNLMTVRLAKLRHIKTVYIAHGMVFREQAGKAPALIQLEERLLTIVDAVVAISHTERDLIVQQYPQLASKISVIPHGVSTSFTASSFAASPTHTDRVDWDLQLPIVLYVGRRTEDKGLGDLIRAIERIMAPFHLVIIGAPGDADSLVYHSHAYQQGKVTILEPLPQQSLAHWYQRAEILCLPSHYETFGLVALEAMHYGCAVALSDQVGLVSFLQPDCNCVIYPAQDDTALAAQLTKIIEDEALRNRLRVLAQQAAQEFTWPKAALEYCRLLQQITYSGATPSRM